MNVNDAVKAATSDAAEVVERRLLLWAVVGTLTLTAVGFATATLYLVLAKPLGPAWACALTAIACALTALAVILIFRIRRPDATHKTDPGETQGLSDQDAVGHLIATFAAAYRATKQ